MSRSLNWATLATSRARMVPMKRMAAFWATLSDSSMEPEQSMSRASEKGRSPSLKKETDWGRPSSNTAKSPSPSPVT